MINSDLTANTASARPTGNPAISFPFLWQDARRVVWLRSADGIDICHSAVSGFQIGQRNSFAPPNSVAWSLRISKDVVLSLRNAS